MLITRDCTETPNPYLKTPNPTPLPAMPNINSETFVKPTPCNPTLD
jgi:hypothetical protein